MWRLLFRLLVLALVSSMPGRAQEPLYTLKVEVPLVSVDAAVRDASGKPVNNLYAKDFELYEDGVKQEIRNFSPVATPYNVFLLFDRSGSTQHKWVFMQKAVASFIASLRPQDRIAIASFDFDFQMELPWTGDRQKAVLALADLIHPRAMGGTDFYDALDRTLRREVRKVSGRRAVVVLTDGRDTSLYRTLVRKNRLLEIYEDRGFQKALRAAREQQIPVYFVAVNTDRNLELNLTGGDEYRNLHIIFPRSTIPEDYLTQVRYRMEQLSEISGGRVLFPSRIEEIIPLYEQIGRELGTSYSLGYVSSNPRLDGHFRQIEVRTRGANLQVTQSRSGYYVGTTPKLSEQKRRDRAK